MITKSVEQRFLDNPGYIEVDGNEAVNYLDLSIWQEYTGPGIYGAVNTSPMDDTMHPVGATFRIRSAP